MDLGFKWWYYIEKCKVHEFVMSGSRY